MTRPKKKTKPDMSDWLTTGQFGLIVGRTGKTVRAWIEQGCIPAACVRRENGHYRIRRLAQHCLGSDD
ncbi:MAG: hypothetical protein ABGZ53_22350 [Fuerstiella sp.]